MELHNLTPSVGSTHRHKRKGRGQGSGRGGTATRGHKGAQARSGYKRKPGFEGGQMRLLRRVPKFGFNNPNRLTYKAINLDLLARLAAQANTTCIDIAFLQACGLIGKHHLCKILGRGELTVKLSVTAHAFSAAAKAAIEKQGGSVIKL